MCYTISHWNACKRDQSGEFKRIIEKHGPDIICVQETHLKPDQDF